MLLVAPLTCLSRTFFGVPVVVPWCGGDDDPPPHFIDFIFVSVRCGVLVVRGVEVTMPQYTAVSLGLWLCRQLGCDGGGDVQPWWGTPGTGMRPFSLVRCARARLQKHTYGLGLKCAHT